MSATSIRSGQVPGGETGVPIRRVLDWVGDFVLNPHPELGRTGSVCPFVEPAMRQDTLVVRERPVRSGADVDDLVAVLLDCVTEFDEVGWEGNRILHAMLVLFPEFTDQDGLLLDEAHARVKDLLVRRDIMMAPFHPLCDESAARSPRLLAFQSPVPMVAIRRLAFHDILFLYEKEEWFHHYARKYGNRYLRSGKLDPVYVERYRAGVAAFGEVTG